MKAQLVSSLNFPSLEKKLSFAGLDSWLNLVHEMYGYKTYRYAVIENSHALAALALVEINHPIFGHYLATAPFGSYGGLAFETPEARDLLLDEARRLAGMSKPNMFPSALTKAPRRHPTTGSKAPIISPT